MHCENCGQKLESNQTYCTSCGTKVSHQENQNFSSDSWWLRLLKVAYIILYIPLPFILYITWTINASTWDYYAGSKDNSAAAFWYCVLAAIIYLTIIRLIKIAILFIALGSRPKWKKEFKQIY